MKMEASRAWQTTARHAPLRALVATIALVVLFLAVLPLLMPAPLAYADESDVVYDQAGLSDWLDAHNATGGSVTLGAPITITEPHFRIECFSESETITIDTASFGIIIAENAGLVILEYRVFITGAGAPSPVVLVQQGGSLSLGDYRFSFAPSDISSIAATGENGIALYMQEGGTLSTINQLFKLRSEGTAGIAFYIEGDFIAETDSLFKYSNALKFCVIEAPGRGGIGIVSAIPVYLFLCRVTADSAAIRAPAAVLDTCMVAPEVSGAEIISRTLSLSATTMVDMRLIPMGETPSDWYRISLSLDALDAPSISVIFNVYVDKSQINTDIPGIYPMPIHIPAPLDMADHDFDNFKVEVFNPAVPRFLSSGLAGFFGPVRYWLDYYYSGTIEDLVLWRSDDLGKTWYKWWDGAVLDGSGAVEGSPPPPDVFVDYGILSVEIANPNEELTSEVWLVFEVLSQKTDSRTLSLQFSVRDPDDGIGGDRTGTDRVTDGGDGRGDGSDGGNDQNSSSEGKKDNDKGGADNSPSDVSISGQSNTTVNQVSSTQASESLTDASHTQSTIASQTEAGAYSDTSPSTSDSTRSITAEQTPKAAAVQTVVPIASGLGQHAQVLLTAIIVTAIVLCIAAGAFFWFRMQRTRRAQKN